jgi:methionine-rich copper-binding protein CopC
MAAVASVYPNASGVGAGVNSHVQVTFASAMTASTITTSTFQLLDGASAVPARLSYNSSGKTATLDSNTPLIYNHTYNVVVKGGASGVKDSGNGTLAADYTFSFTTAADPTTGAGGPILVITKSTNPYSKYYPEILHAEGLNAFGTADISTVSAASLANYKLVILSEMTLTAAQVSTISTWVNGGGKLIAMRPDKQLASLLGLTDTGATINDTYLDIDNSNPVGSGLTATSMQYHSTADRYTLSGATSLVALFSNSTTATGNPAVTTRSVGANGGQAAAFVFDLAKSVIQTRQGNPAWSGQERDGSTPIRSDDLFFGGSSADWVDLAKVSIPQADEQQRLLANMITTMTAPVMPMPRFWYFPNGAKAEVVMTGDDHNSGGTIGRWNTYISDGNSGAQPIRGTSYIFPSSFTDSQGALYTSQGFEMGLHVDITSGTLFGGSGDVGVNWTSFSQLDSLYTSELNTYNSAFPSSPTPTTVRTHAIVWSDYDSQPQVEFSHRIRLDTNYYYWPGTWILDRPGMFTGSGMPMRFAKLDGSLIDVYQAATQITDESNQTEPKNINALLDGATGANGYYGAFTINAHTDASSSAVSDAVIASAQAHNVPVVTADALMRWTDGRNASTFNNMTWSAGTNTLTFTQVVGVGASGLQAMMPMNSGANLTLSTITVNGNPVAFTQQTIKGIKYAFYPATAGAVSVQYALDSTPPTVASKTPASGAANVPITINPTATFNEDVQAATVSMVLKDASNTTIPGTTSYDSATHAATFTPASNLSPNATYTITVSGAKDLSNNTMVGSTSWSFTSAGTGPFNIWSSSVTPSNPFTSDGSVELGVKFKADIGGFISGIRFYKGSGSSGTHTGTLWSSAGTQLATATFINESATGWQQVNFSSPVAITAGTTYVASYHANNGYAADSGYFANAIDNVYLHALSDNASGGNGVYRYGASTAFPNNTFSSTNYWVDVVYSTNLTDTTPPTITTKVPASGATNVALNSNIQAVFSEAIQSGTAVITVKDAALNTVAGSSAYDANTKTITFTPSASLAASTTYTVTVSGAKDTAGNTMTTTSWSFTTAAADTTPPTLVSTNPTSGQTGVSTTAAILATFSEAVQSNTIVITVKDAANNAVAGSTSYDSSTKTVTFTPAAALAGSTLFTVTVSGAKDTAGNTMTTSSWSFTTAAVAGSSYSFWTSSTVPVNSNANDGPAIETGVKFSSSVSGFITGIRFYKGANNTGAHIGNLWSSAGTLLGAATFSNESATGWQQVNFPTPVAVNAGTTYVASYYSPTGTYNADAAYFNTARDVGPIHALANSESGNGVFAYSANSAFPTNSGNGANYWVDVVFSTQNQIPDTTPPTVTSTSPASGATNVAITATITANFSESVQAATISFIVKDAANNAVAGSVVYNDTTHSATFMPTSPLAGFTTYTATVTGAKDTAGNTMSGAAVWSFTTAAVDNTPPTVTATSPVSGATGVSTATTITATFSEAVQSSTITMTLKDPSNNTIAGSTNYNSATQTATFTPSSALNSSATYTMTVSGAKDTSNNTMAPVSWSFTTAAAATTYSFWPNSTAPASTNNYDGSTIELGFKFRANSAGNITGIRFYKGTQDTGTHIGNLWSSTGTKLASVTFSGETASGWQTMSFASPISLTVGTTYVASYFSPTGRYAANSNYFTTAIDNGPIHALSNSESPNGLYRYTGSSAFPNSSFGASNYWVDIVFATAAPADTTPPTVTSTTPANNAINVATNTAISAVFSEPIQSGTATFLVKDAAQNVITGATTYGSNSAAFTPTSALSNSATYTVTLSGVQDIAGNTMTSTNWSFTTIAPPDTTPPTVTTTAPAANASNVSVSTTVSATFSEAIQSGTAVITVKDPAQNVISGTTTFASNSATFTPTSALANSTTYTVTISGAKDLANNTMTDSAFSFTTASLADTTPPSVTTTAPAANAANVSVSTTVSATFSEAIQSGSAVITVKDPAQNIIPGTTTFASNSATFTPTSALANSTTYTVTISGAKDLANNTMTDSAFSFTTASLADTTPPTVTTTAPAANATNVSISTTVSATFSEAIQSGSAVITVKDPAQNIIPGTIVQGSNSATFTPSSPLSYSTTYTVTVSGATDLAGNTMTDSTFSFTTIAPPDLTPPTITSTTPAADATGVSPTAPISATFSEPVQSGTIVVTLKDPSNNTVPGAISYNSGTNTVTFTPSATLLGTSTYTITISGAKDTSNNTMSPVTWSFTTAVVTVTWTQTTAADFSTGTSAGTAVTNTSGGEIQLAPAFRDDFNGTALSSAWTVIANSVGAGSPNLSVSGGVISLGKNQIKTTQTFVGTGIEASVTFNSAQMQQVGLATDLLTTAGNSGAYFTTKSTTNTLYARVNQNGTLTDVSVGALPSGAHIYAIYPVPTGFSFYIDGVLKTTIAKTLPVGTALSAALSSQNGGKPIKADYVKILSFTTGGTYTSAVRDTAKTSTWGTLTYNATLPAGTSILVEVSTGDTATPDGSWSAWTAVSSGSTIPNSTARYIRYRITFITTDPTQTATVTDITISYT